MKKKNLFKAVLLALFVLPALLLITSCGNAASERGYKLSSEAAALSTTNYTDEEINAYVKENLKNSAYYHMITNVDSNTEREMWGSFYYEESSYLDEVENITIYRYDLVGDDITLYKNKLYLFQYFDDLAYGNSESNLAEAFKTFFGKDINSLDASVKGFFAPNEYTDNEDYSSGIKQALALKFLDTFKDEAQDYADDFARYFYCIPRSNITLDKRSLYFTEEEAVSSLPGILFYEYTILVAPDIVAPDFDTTDYYTLPVDVDNPPSVDEILSEIHASDDVDGDISDSVELVSTTYNPNALTLGIHEFVVSVSDAAGNINQATFYIPVCDFVKPVISGTSSYTVSYDEPVSLETIKNALTITDNFSSNLILNLVSDTYTGHETELGEHSIVFNTIDEAENVADDFIVPLFVYDDKAPIITAPSEFTVNSNATITLDDIRSKISIVDGHDGVITDYTINGFEAYLKDTKVVRNYILTIECSDGSNNAAAFSTVLKVLDKNVPNFWFSSDFVIQLPKGTELTKEMIISYLSQIGEIEANNVESVNYELDSSKIGVYAVSILLKDDTTYTCSIQVGVSEEKEAKLPWWNVWWNNICNFFKAIGNFFVSVWNWLCDLFSGKLFEADVRILNKE